MARSPRRPTSKRQPSRATSKRSEYYEYDDEEIIDPKLTGELQERQLELTSRMWVNRRRMAWMCLFAIMIVTALVLFKIPMERIQASENVLIWFFIVCSSTVAGYFGFSTYHDIKAFDERNKRR